MNVNVSERLISPADPMLRYTGRIGMEDPENPFFVYVCSSVQLRVAGKTLRVFLTNQHS